MWSVVYSREVRNYIYDPYLYTQAVWDAIKTLRETEEGLPSAGYTELDNNIYLWEVAEHQVVYERFVAERKLLVTVLKPR